MSKKTALLARAKEPFHFYTKLNLIEFTGKKATNLPQLVETIKEVPGSVIYHHTHHYLQQHLYLSPEPPNDFAYWVTYILREEELGEEIASIDLCEFSTIRSLRERIIQTIEEHLASNPGPLRMAPPGAEFHFFKTITFILPTPYVVSDLLEFLEVLRKITIHSIYFHMFEAKLRLEKGENDFSRWIEDMLGEEELAKEIARLDPYTFTIEGLRGALCKLITKYIPGEIIECQE
ncbi:MAG: DUF5752 family protein [bacterium]